MKANIPEPNPPIILQDVTEEDLYSLFCVVYSMTIGHGFFTSCSGASMSEELTKRTQKLRDAIHHNFVMQQDYDTPEKCNECGEMVTGHEGKYKDNIMGEGIICGKCYGKCYDKRYEPYES